MSLKSLMIRSIETRFTAEYIANVFWKKEIAKVSAVTLIPQILNNHVSNIAYIDIEDYCDTESAYDFICRMKDDYFIFEHYYEDCCWIIEKNKHNNGDLNIETFTKLFNNQFYQSYNNEDGYLSDSSEHALIYPINDDYEEEEGEIQEFLIQRPIKGLSNDHYSIDEAYQYLHELKAAYASTKNNSRNFIQYEIKHFENEIRIHHAIEKSKFVTLRKNQYCDPFDGRLNKPVLRRNVSMMDDQNNLLKIDLLC